MITGSVNSYCTALIGRIDKGHPVRDFHGYSDNSSTSKKIMQHVFKQGDLYFRLEEEVALESG